jgi:glyoxylase-like metal-dependent hydrolase (beta-lactamase superfamily II)
LARVRRVVAPNPGPYTGPGTNTWLILEPPAAVVIDPGPDDAAHLEAVLAALGDLPVGAVLVTHSHPDHLPLAAALASRTRSRVAAFPELTDGDLVRVGKLTLEAVYTPGHAHDHLCFALRDDGAVFTGDLVLGQGSTMVTYPDGDMSAYLASLDRLAALQPRILFPGHWDPVLDAAAKIAEYRAHRLDRERQILDEVRRAPGTAEELTRRVYGGEVGEELLPAAEMTLRAHLAKLVADGAVTQSADRFLSSPPP